MAVIGILLILFGGVVLGAWAMRDRLANAQPRTGEVLRSQLDTLESCQRLSLAAWQTRHEMFDEVMSMGVDPSRLGSDEDEES